MQQLRNLPSIWCTSAKKWSSLQMSSVICRYDQFVYLAFPLSNSGANAHEKKCKRGKGTKFVAIFLKSPLSKPLNLSDAVTPLIISDITQFKSANEGSLF